MRSPPHSSSGSAGAPIFRTAMMSRGASSSTASTSATGTWSTDRDYRRRAAEGRLRLIAPRRFNPQREAWLPVLHTERGGRVYTALFSNTAQAHRPGKTHDWVVLYCDRDGRERQATVVTAQRGALEGKRVVRGREADCARHHGLDYP